MSFSLRNSPLFAHATFYEQNSFESPRFTTNSFLLMRSQFFVKPNFIWREDEFYVSSETIHLKGRVEGFLPLLTDFFRLSLPVLRSRVYYPPPKTFPSPFFLHGLAKRPHPFSPGARKVLTFSPVKKNRCCIRISFFISHAIL